MLKMEEIANIWEKRQGNPSIAGQEEWNLNRFFVHNWILFMDFFHIFFPILQIPFYLIFFLVYSL